jgi:hypothetical protein
MRLSFTNMLLCVNTKKVFFKTQIQIQRINLLVHYLILHKMPVPIKHICLLYSHFTLYMTFKYKCMMNKMLSHMEAHHPQIKSYNTSRQELTTQSLPQCQDTFLWVSLPFRKRLLPIVVKMLSLVKTHI